MTDRAQLVADLVCVLVREGPRSGTRLAVRVGARKADVLHELNAKPLFDRVGGGRHVVWRLRGTGREPLQGDGSTQVMVVEVIRRLELLESRVDALERRNGAYT